MYAHTPLRCLVVLPRGALFTLFTLLARLAPTTAHGSAAVYTVYAASSPGPNHPYTRPRRTFGVRSAVATTTTTTTTNVMRLPAHSPALLVARRSRTPGRRRRCRWGAPYAVYAVYAGRTPEPVFFRVSCAVIAERAAGPARAEAPGPGLLRAERLYTALWAIVGARERGENPAALARAERPSGGAARRSGAHSCPLARHQLRCGRN